MKLKTPDGRICEKHRLRINKNISAGLDITVDGDTVLIEVYLDIGDKKTVVKRTILIDKRN